MVKVTNSCNSIKSFWRKCPPVDSMCWSLATARKGSTFLDRLIIVYGCCSFPIKRENPIWVKCTYSIHNFHSFSLNFLVLLSWLNAAKCSHICVQVRGKKHFLQYYHVRQNTGFIKPLFLPLQIQLSMHLVVKCTWFANLSFNVQICMWLTHIHTYILPLFTGCKI